MASLEHTINVIFGASANSSFNSTISDVSGGLSDLDAGVQSIAAPVANLTKSLLALDAAVAAIALTLVGSAVKAAGDYSQQVLLLGSAFNATKEQSGKLGEELLNFSKGSSNSLKDIEEAAGMALSTGTDASEITKLLTENQKLSAISGESLATVTGVIAKSLNAYGESAEQAAPYADALFLAAQQGDTNMAALSSQLGAVTSTAAASKVPFDDLASAVAATTIAGVNTAESMTKLKSLFLELSVPSDALKAALGGVSLEGDGLQAVMVKIKEVTGGTTDKMSALFSSSEAMSAATILANDSAGVFATTLGLMADKAGTVDKNYQQFAGSFDATNTKVANNLQAALIEIGKPLLDEYGTVGGAVAKLFDGIGVSAKEGGLKVIVDAVEELAGNVGDTLAGVAGALPDALKLLDFDNLIDSFKNLGSKFSGAFEEIFGGGLDLSKPEDLATALQAGVNIATTLVDVTSGIITSFKPFIDLIAAAADEMSNADGASAETIGNIMGALTLVADLGTSLGGFLVALNAGGGDVKAVFGGVVGAIEIFINGVDSFFLLLQTYIAQALVDFYEFKAAITFGDTSKEAEADALKWQGVLDGINKDIATNGEDISKAWDKMWGDTGADKAAESVKAAAEKVVEGTKGIGTAAEETNKGMKEVGDTLVFGAESYKDFLAKVDAFKAAGIDVTSEWTEAGGVIKFAAEKTGDLSKTTDASSTALDKQAAAATTAKKTLEDKKKATDDLSESQKLSIQHTYDMEKVLVELASNEKIKYMEFSAQIKVAGIEADVKAIEAAFASVTSIVESTGKNVTDMWALFSGENVDFTDKMDLKNAALKAEEMAKKALENATKLNDAQVKYMQAKTDLLLSGKGMITIKGDGLADNLQAVLKGMIEFAQVEANAEGLELLLP